MLCSDGLVGWSAMKKFKEVLAPRLDLASTFVIDLQRAFGWWTGQHHRHRRAEWVEKDCPPTPKTSPKYQTMTLPGERPAGIASSGEGYRLGSHGSAHQTPDGGVAQPVARVSLVITTAVYAE